MSDTAQGSGWWRASDGRWYPPEATPGPPPPGQSPSAGWSSPPGFNASQDWVRPRHPVATTSTNGFAVASLVLGILWIFGLGALLALIFGLIGRAQISRSAGTQSGAGLAVAGIVLGCIGIAGEILLIVLSATSSGTGGGYLGG